uniref:Uncharacterized protein n=1 Tax=Anopheles atroparvus TaxID=41427 RepID=A0A182JLS0_ANOAO
MTLASDRVRGCTFANDKAISREESDDSTQQNNHHQLPHHHHHHHGHGHNRGGKVPFNGYTSEEYLDRLEPNGNIPADKSYSKLNWIRQFQTKCHASRARKESLWFTDNLPDSPSIVVMDFRLCAGTNIIRNTMPPLGGLGTLAATSGAETCLLGSLRKIIFPRCKITLV